jgi:putative transposase
MARRTRCSDAGYVYHVLNRAVGRATLFRKSPDYAAFEEVLRQAWERLGMRLLSYVLMPNHWHLVVWPQEDDVLSTYLQWLTVTLVRRWHAHHHTAGTGPIYQGRFKSFPVQEDEHLLTVCRYVERNPLRAGLVKRAEAWRWSSLWHRTHTTQVPWLSEWPMARSQQWSAQVNAVETEAELAALRGCNLRGAPYGDAAWQERTARELGLESSLRLPGRPKKTKTETPRNLT